MGIEARIARLWLLGCGTSLCCAFSGHPKLQSRRASRVEACGQESGNREGLAQECH